MEVRRLKGKGRVPGGQDGAPLLRLVLLAVFFLAGVFLGQVLARSVPERTGTELEQYLTGFVQVGAEGRQAKTLLSALVIYFRYPVAAFVLGFVSAGVLLLPAVSAVFGFFLSFSVCCFTAAFGEDGVLLALAVFGFRCMVTMPCFFLLAAPSWGMAASRLSVGSGRRSLPQVCGRSGWLRFGAVCGVLLAGVCVELFLPPYFLRLVLERILI